MVGSAVIQKLCTSNSKFKTRKAFEPLWPELIAVLALAFSVLTKQESCVSPENDSSISQFRLRES
jgi:hypothetical protein